MKTTIVFQPEDRDLPQLILECQYSFHEGEPMVMYGDNPYPGSPAGVEVESVVCVDVDSATAPLLDGDPFRKIIGGLAWEARPKEITRMVFERHCDESQGDPDRERDE